MISVVVAMDRERGIGKAGSIPWKLKGDMRFFRELTSCPDALLVHARYRLDTGLRDKRTFAWEDLALETGPAAKPPAPQAGNRNAVIMGRKTWDSLPPVYRPLPGRFNAVLSRSAAAQGSAITAAAQGSAVAAATHLLWPGLDPCLAALAADPGIKNVYVIGGGEIYIQALARPGCARVYLTVIESAFACDTFLPPLPAEFRETASTPKVDEGGLSYRIRLFEK